MLDAWGRFVFAKRLAILVVCLVFFGVAAYLLSRGGTLTTGVIHGVEATDAQDTIDHALGKRAGPSFTAMFHSETLTTDDPDFFEAMGKALEPLDSTPEVASVLSPVEAPPQLGDKLISKDKHSAIAVVVLKGEVDAAEALYPGVRAKIDAALPPHTLSLGCTGTLQFRRDFQKTLEDDLTVSEIVTLPLALIVLLFVFRSVVASLVPVGVGALSVMGGIAMTLVLSKFTDMPTFTINVASLLGLAVAIDYSLFFVSRFREELKSGRSTEDAVVRTMSTTGRAVLFSGLAVAIGVSGLLFFPHSYMIGIGLAGVIVVLFAVVFALTFLPALLGVLGPRIDAGTLPFLRPSESDGAIWRKIAPWVMDRPARVLVPTLAIVLALGVPFLRIRMAALDVTLLPMRTEARSTYEAIKTDFPAQTSGRSQVVVTFPTEELTPERAQAVLDLRDRLARLPGVDGVESLFDFDPTLPPAEAVKLVSLREDLRPVDVATAMEFTTGRGSTVLTVLTHDSPASQAARDLVHTLRLDRRVADGTLRVAGQAAKDVDSLDFLEGHSVAPLVFVVICTYVILFLLLGSVILPLKAVVMNFLSIAGSFGALVFIFQDGHLSSLLKFEPGPIEPTLPPLLFCVVFGLSMDYEVLLLSRMREEYLRTKDNRAAVTEGLARSGRLITSAAGIMVAVFVAFSLASFILVKAMGVGMTVAVTLDATLVRLLIVPATMRLLGDLNWWAPKSFAKLLERTTEQA